MHYDVIIIGGGPGGTTAAKELATGGKKVAIIEAKHWGGTCLNCEIGRASCRERV